MAVKLIAAVGLKGELGYGNQLCWRLKEDLQHFRALTTGHVVVMGRNTYESIGHPLPERLNIVVSTTVREIPGCVVVDSYAAALQAAWEYNPRLTVWVIGGAQLYRTAMATADSLVLTRIYRECSQADTWFDFSLIEEFEEHRTETPEILYSDTGEPYRFFEYRRKVNA